jgi:hypothetical protein
MIGLIWLSSVECSFKNETEGIVAYKIIAFIPNVTPENCG